MLNHTLSAEKTAKPNAKKDVVKIAVPSGLMHELAASDMHGLAKDVIFWVVARHQHADRSTGLHQRLLDKAIGDDARKAIITFIKQSRYIAVALQGKFEKGRQAKRYYLKGAEDLVSHASQHNYEIVCDASCFDSSGFVFRSVDFGPLMDCVKNGFDLLDWNIDRFQAEWSLGFVDEPTLDSDDIDAEVIAEKAEKHADYAVDWSCQVSYTINRRITALFFQTICVAKIQLPRPPFSASFQKEFAGTLFIFRTIAESV